MRFSNKCLPLKVVSNMVRFAFYSVLFQTGFCSFFSLKTHYSTAKGPTNFSRPHIVYALNLACCHITCSGKVYNWAFTDRPGQ